jgi:hypothetical protein
MALSMSWLKADLQQYCIEAGISFKDRDTKQDLLGLIQGSSGHSRERSDSMQPAPAGGSGSSGSNAYASEPNSTPGQQPSMRWLKVQLQAYCEQHQISFRAQDTKQQLLDLIQARKSTASRRSGDSTVGAESSDDSGRDSNTHFDGSGRDSDNGSDGWTEGAEAAETGAAEAEAACVCACLQLRVCTPCVRRGWQCSSKGSR